MRIHTIARSARVRHVVKAVNILPVAG
jgi:hypothetical protein